MVVSENNRGGKMKDIANVRYEINDRIHIECTVCGMVTEQIVIKSNYEDTQATQCTECQVIDEWII